MLTALKKRQDQVILALFEALLAVTPPVPERSGDTLRFALPTIGFGCALRTGGGV